MDTDLDYLTITFETIDEGITIYDKDLNLVVWNKQYQMMGITPEELLYRGANLIESYLLMAKNGVFGEGDPYELATQRVNGLKMGPLIEEEELNSAANRLIRIKRFRLKNGGICATFRDVTEERLVENQLRQSTKLDALGRLSGGIAHDLNNVLAIIVGSLELAQINSPDNNCLHLQQAVQASDRGAALVRSLLAFARQQPLKPSVTTVTQSFEKLNSMLFPLVRDWVTFEVTSSANEENWLVEMDIDQFETTLVNLVINAKDATHIDGRIAIGSKNITVDEDSARKIGISAGEFVCISVTDNGTGMHPDVLDKAIDPFFTTKLAGQGTGLGLSMAHGFAAQSQGYLKIESEVEIGTKVSIYLPRSRRKATRKITQNATALNFDGLRVLVVDDDPMVKDSIVEQIRALGSAVTSAGSGVEAIQMDKWDQFDVLVTDSAMPNIDGALLADIAVAKNSKLKVLLISGFLDDPGPDQHENKSIDGVLKKPFRLNQLSKAIERAVQSTN